MGRVKNGTTVRRGQAAKVPVACQRPPNGASRTTPQRAPPPVPVRRTPSGYRRRKWLPTRSRRLQHGGSSLGPRPTSGSLGAAPRPCRAHIKWRPGSFVSEAIRSTGEWRSGSAPALGLAGRLRCADLHFCRKIATETRRVRCANSGAGWLESPPAPATIRGQGGAPGAKRGRPTLTPVRSGARCAQPACPGQRRCGATGW